MLIILEGPDAAGKSTLARDIRDVLLREYRPIDVLHARLPTTHPLDEYELPLVTYRPNSDSTVKHIICDRWHLGEAVYPQLLRRPTRWDLAVERHLWLFMKSRGAYVVKLLPDIIELKTRLGVRGDDLIDVNQLVAIRARYRELDPQHFDAEYADNTPVPRTIVSEANLRAAMVRKLARFVTYVGNVRPSVLLFGDVRQDRLQEDGRLTPAFMPYPATSGHYLLTHLDVITHNVGIANACDVDDPMKLCEAVNPTGVVALGQRAAAQLAKLGIPHGTVPHPQYVRRFHHKHGVEYANIIMESAVSGKDMTSWRP